jgi:hypothetical protein
MNTSYEPTDYNDLIAGNSGSSIVYANTAKADTDKNGGSYQENNKNIKRPHSRPGSSFITLPRPRPVISGKS